MQNNKQYNKNLVVSKLHEKIGITTLSGVQEVDSLLRAFELDSSKLEAPTVSKFESLCPTPTPTTTLSDATTAIRGKRTFSRLIANAIKNALQLFTDSAVESVTSVMRFCMT